MSRRDRRLRPVLGLVATALLLAAGAASSSGAWAAEGDGALPLFVDAAGLVEASEADALERRLGEISDARAADVVIVTVGELGRRSAQAFADDYFDYGPAPDDQSSPGGDVNAGYGRGQDRSGILLLVAAVDREWAISTTGASIDVFSDREQRAIMAEVQPLLGSGAWAEAFGEFAERVDAAYADAASWGGRGPIPWGMVAVVAVLAGFVGGFGTVTVWRRQLKSVHPAAGARAYLTAASLTSSHDRLVSRQTTVIDTSPSSRRGGSSTHFGSSGIRHGGSSGRF